MLVKVLYVTVLYCDQPVTLGKGSRTFAVMLDGRALGPEVGPWGPEGTCGPQG